MPPFMKVVCVLGTTIQGHTGPAYANLSDSFVERDR